MSKATRGLHVSEDVMCGLNVLLRGGRIRYTEAVSCGKGRDMGFNSILAFETKVRQTQHASITTRHLLMSAEHKRATQSVLQTPGDSQAALAA
eukprot:360560-Chlamydomonas_euryale.AAC.2